jgi:two-component system, OmpR family, phosphate regulon response regulator PhoB
MMNRILIVEDDFAIQSLIALTLKQDHYEVWRAHDVKTANALITQAKPDLILLDWMLPDGDGLSLARAWRKHALTQATPIILLTAKDDEADKVMGLDAGVDDYITKPFSPLELLARIRAVFRRIKPELLSQALALGDLVLDPKSFVVTYLEQALKLSFTEFRLLQLLMSYPQRLLTREQILSKIWGQEADIEDRTVDVHIKRLRANLAQHAGLSECIETVRGAGYRFNLN